MKIAVGIEKARASYVVLARTRGVKRGSAEEGRIVDRDPFLLRLKDSGLLTPEQLRDVEQCFPDARPDTAVAQELIGRGMLTPYQAQQLLLDPERPLVLGQYRILEEIGRGGMGHVYKALHTVMGRVVALKIIAPELVKDAHALRLFRREVQAATLLQHPNIAMAFDANECAGEHFLVMEYVDGPDLDAVVRRHGGLPIALACSVVRQTAEALQYAHEKGMVHRDIKPANLLLAGWDDRALTPWLHDRAAAPSPLPIVKVLDFGIARLRLPAGGDTLPVRNPGNVIGTPDYIAPEQAHNIHAADVRSDLYSLGCTFYYTLAGRVPFPGESALEKVLHHALEEAMPLAVVRSDVPPEIAAIVYRLMEKDPDQRFQTPGELARALEPWCSPLALAHSTDPVAAAAAAPTHEADALGDTTELEKTGGDDTSPVREVALVEGWCRWVDIVEDFARRRGNRSGTSQTEYAAVHGLAVAACRVRADTAAGETRRLFHDLRERVQPWLSLEALARADREILADLLAHCRRLEPLLTGGRGRRSRRRIAAALCLGAALFGLAWWLTNGLSFLRLRHGESWSSSVLDNVRRVIASLGSEVQAHPILWGSALCALVVLLSIYLVARLPRV
jgi:serine/threonine-protein kinase